MQKVRFGAFLVHIRLLRAWCLSHQVFNSGIIYMVPPMLVQVTGLLGKLQNNIRADSNKQKLAARRAALFIGTKRSPPDEWSGWMTASNQVEKTALNSETELTPSVTFGHPRFQPLPNARKTGSTPLTSVGLGS